LVHGISPSWWAEHGEAEQFIKADRKKRKRNIGKI
jgi:hypothetical protein